MKSKIRLIVITLAVYALSAGAASAGGCDVNLTDSFLWLEQVESERALAWVRQQNDRTTAALTQHPLYADIFAEAKAITLAEDRVPFAGWSYGHFWNFWQDKDNKQGLLRRTSYDEYLKDAPAWETILDLDALSKAENEEWVFGGWPRLIPGSSRRLLQLSRGGKDAKVVREFDVDTKSFVTDGFNLPEAKTSISAIDFDTVLVATNEGPESLTTSGYARVLKRWRRGQPLSEAPVVFTGEKTDLAVAPFVVTHGDEKYVCVSRALTFYTSQTYLMNAAGDFKLLPLPESAEVESLRADRVYLKLRDPLTAAGQTFAPGSLISVALHDASLASARLVFAPRANQSIQSISVRADRIMLSLIEDVRGKLLELRVHDDQITERDIKFPELGLGILSYAAPNDDDPSDFATLSYSDHLTPPTTYRVLEKGGEYSLEKTKQAPTRFAAGDLEVTQHFAVSKDGTKVPYFMLAKKGVKRDGTNPTILYGYGGFEISMTPSYVNVTGKVWLERGGVYVISNIRGGGEYGPAWHQAALKHNRQRAFDDFAAVAEDLVARKITSPEHLGIRGGSNGGLLTGTTMVQRPDLLRAALIQVPLLDMVRYPLLPAGASWMAEYGDPELPADLEAILKYSPYQNLRADARYPTPLITTSTKDDRVHPGHARKMVARLIEQGHPVMYFENINGGHAGSSNLDETVMMQALEWTYLWERLK